MNHECPAALIVLQCSNTDTALKEKCHCKMYRRRKYQRKSTVFGLMIMQYHQHLICLLLLKNKHQFMKAHTHQLQIQTLHSETDSLTFSELVDTARTVSKFNFIFVEIIFVCRPITAAVVVVVYSI